MQVRLVRILGGASVAVCCLLALCLTASAGAKVLRVGTYHHIKGQYRTIQAAVDHARPGDWILVAPGDYKTTSSHAPKGVSDAPAAIVITTRDITIRGMNRRTVVVDGTKPGYPECSRKPAAQNYGPTQNGGPAGLDGILVWKASDVNVENLTSCNFLGGTGDTGNDIWWDGQTGDDHIHGWGFLATYLSATSTFFKDEEDAATYGLFSSAWQGGVFAHDYASNFNDAGYYIGACLQLCTQVIKDSQSQYNALGYSGSNSGGTMLIEHNRFDNNEDGFDTNSQNGDNPPPQNGACPAGIKPPVKGAPTCWVLYKNDIYDNNNPNVPRSGSAAQGPVGTGASISGGRNDTLLDNTFADNGAWGTIFVPYPDSGPPCTGGTMNGLGPGSCLYDEYGDHLLDNTYTHDGFFGNQTNGDFAAVNLEKDPPDCFSGNRDTSGKLTSSPANAEHTYPTCTGHAESPDTNAVFADEVLCDTQVALTQLGSVPCLPTDHYPRQTEVVMHPLPKNLATMPDPCRGVPKNPWCPGRRGRRRRHR